MTDRELLVLAAKAAGYDLVSHAGYDEYDDTWVTLVWIRNVSGRLDKWNPLTDDGDALRLAVKLGIDMEFGATCIATSAYDGERYLNCDLTEYRGNPYAATRRAIVSAAAEIGKEMK